MTALLQRGRNTIGAKIAEGWFTGRLGGANGPRNIWGDRLGLLAQVEVDGKVVVKTDEKWHWKHDQNVDHLRWRIVRLRMPQFEWLATAEGLAGILPFPPAKISHAMAPPVRRVMEVQPIALFRTPSGKQVLDFGQNLVGWLRINVDIDASTSLLSGMPRCLRMVCLALDRCALPNAPMR